MYIHTYNTVYSTHTTLQIYTYTRITWRMALAMLFPDDVRKCVNDNDNNDNNNNNHYYYYICIYIDR